MPGVQKPHCEPWCVHHGGLDRMQCRPRREILDGDELGAVDLAEQQDAGIDGLVDGRAHRCMRPKRHRAGAAIALGAAFLGAEMRAGPASDNPEAWCAGENPRSRPSRPCRRKRIASRVTIILRRNNPARHGEPGRRSEQGLLIVTRIAGRPTQAGSLEAYQAPVFGIEAQGSCGGLAGRRAAAARWRCCRAT